MLRYPFTPSVGLTPRFCLGPYEYSKGCELPITPLKERRNLEAADLSETASQVRDQQSDSFFIETSHRVWEFGIKARVT